jgi:hypothetical protein
VESGLAKILTIGLGKHRGAQTVHAYGTRGLAHWMPRAAQAMVQVSGTVLAGLAILENAYDQTARLVGIAASEIGGAGEAALLEEAKGLMASLPFDDIDVLVVDEMGKNISGTGMDTNIIGRMLIRGVPEFVRPNIRSIVVRDLTDESHGNGAGIDNVAGVPNPNYNPKFPEGPGNYQYLQPGQPGYVAPWGTSALNYYFEGGLSTFAQYILQQPFAPGAPLANQQIFDAIKLAFQVGSGNLWLTAYVNTLSAIAQLAEPISEYLYRGIGSYLGSAFANIDSVYDYSYYAGWSGVFRYVGGVITTPWAITEGPLAGVTLPFGNPNPYPLPAPEPAAPAAALSSSVAAAKSVSVDTGTAAPVVEAEVAAPKAGETPSADSTPDDSTPAAGGSSEGTSTEAASDTTVPDTTVPDTKPADTTPAVDSPSNAVADSTADATPAAIKPADTPAATKPADAPAKAAKRPVRGAVERATKKIASAIGGSAAKAAPAAGGSADSGASAG